MGVEARVADPMCFDHCSFVEVVVNEYSNEYTIAQGGGLPHPNLSHSGVMTR